MTHIFGFERSQLLLLPERWTIMSASTIPCASLPVRRWTRSHRRRFQSRHAEATGRPGYAPGDLLKLYIYGYLNRVRSSRRLEAECHRNVEVIWLLRTLKPDFQNHRRFQE